MQIRIIEWLHFSFLVSIVGVLSPMTALAEAPIKLYDDPRILKWSDAYLGGDHGTLEAMLLDVEADLKSDSPHPLAAQVWFQMTENIHSAEDGAEVWHKFTDVQLKPFLEPYGSIHVSLAGKVPGDTFKQYPPDDSRLAKYPDIYFELGYAAEAIAEPELALRYYLQGLKHYPNYFQLAWQIGTQSQFRSLACLALIKKFYDANPQWHEGPLGKLLAYVLNEPLEGWWANDVYLEPIVREWVRMYPKDGRAWTKLGYHAKSAQKHQDAVDNFIKGYRSSPFYANSSVIAEALIRNGQVNEAWEYSRMLARVRALDGRKETQHTAELVMAWAFRKSGDRGSARELLESIYQDSGRRSRWLLSELAELEKADKRYKESIEYLEEAIKLYPKVARTKIDDLIDVTLLSGEAAKAWRIFKEHHEKAQVKSLAYWKKGAKIKKSQNSRDYLKWLGQGLESYPKSTSLLRMRAEHQQSRGKRHFEKAFKDFKTLFDLNPSLTNLKSLVKAKRDALKSKSKYRWRSNFNTWLNSMIDKHPKRSHLRVEYASSRGLKNQELDEYYAEVLADEPTMTELWEARLDFWIKKRNWSKGWRIAKRMLTYGQSKNDRNLTRVGYLNLAFLCEQMIKKQGQGSRKGQDWIKEGLAYLEDYRKIGKLDNYYRYVESLSRGLKDYQTAATALYKRSLLVPDNYYVLFGLINRYSSVLGRHQTWAHGYRLVRRQPFRALAWEAYIRVHARLGGSPIAALWAAEEMRRRGFSTNRVRRELGECRGALGDTLTAWSWGYQNAGAIANGDRYIGWYHEAAKQARRLGSNHVIYEFEYDSAGVRIRRPDGTEIYQKADLRFGQLTEIGSGGVFVKIDYDELGKMSGFRTSNGELFRLVYGDDGVPAYYESRNERLQLDYKDGELESVQCERRQSNLDGDVLLPVGVFVEADDCPEIKRLVKQLSQFAGELENISRGRGDFPDTFDTNRVDSDRVQKYRRFRKHYEASLEQGVLAKELGESWRQLSNKLRESSEVHPKYVKNDLKATSWFLDAVLGQHGVQTLDDTVLDAMNHWAHLNSRLKSSGLNEDDHTYWARLQQFVMKHRHTRGLFSDKTQVEQILNRKFDLLPEARWLPKSSFANEGYWTRIGRDLFLPNNLQDARINQILARQNGDVVVASDRGLSVLHKDVWTWYGYLPSLGRFSRFAEQGKGQLEVTVVHELLDGRMLVGTSGGLFLFEDDYSGALRRWSTEKEGFSSPNITAIAESANGLIVGTVAGLTIGNVDDGFRSLNLSSGEIHSIIDLTMPLERFVRTLSDNGAWLLASEEEFVEELKADETQNDSAKHATFVREWDKTTNSILELESKRQAFATEFRRHTCEDPNIGPSVIENSTSLLGSSVQKLWHSSDEIRAIEAVEEKLDAAIVTESLAPQMGNLITWKVVDERPILDSQTRDQDKLKAETIAVSYDGQFTAVGTENGLIRLHQTSDWGYLGTMDATSYGMSSVRALGFVSQRREDRWGESTSNNEKAVNKQPLLVSAGADGGVLLWDLKSLTAEQILPDDFSSSQILALDVDPSGNYLALIVGGRGVFIWDLSQGTWSFRHELGSGTYGFVLKFSSDGQSLVFGNAGGEVHVWSQSDVPSESGQWLAKAKLTFDTGESGYFSGRSVPQSNIMYLGKANGLVDKLDLDTETLEPVLKLDKPAFDLEVTPDQNHLFVATAGSELFVVDLRASIARAFETPRAEAEVVALARDPVSGRILGAGGMGESRLSKLKALKDDLSRYKADVGCITESDRFELVEASRDVLTSKEWNDGDLIGSLEDDEFRETFFRKFVSLDLIAFAEERKRRVDEVREQLSLFSSSKGVGALANGKITWLIDEPVDDFQVSKDGDKIVWLLQNEIWEGEFSQGEGLGRALKLAGSEDIPYSKAIQSLQFVDIEGVETLMVGTDLGVGLQRALRVEFMELPLELQRNGLKVGPSKMVQAGEDLWLQTQEAIYAYQPSKVTHLNRVYHALLTPPNSAFTLAASGESVDIMFHGSAEMEALANLNASFLKWDPTNERVIVNNNTEIWSIKLSIDEEGEVQLEEDELFDALCSKTWGSDLDSLLVDAKGNIWTASNWTLKRYDAQTKEVTTFGFHLDPEKFPSNTSMLSYLYQTPSGDVMVVGSNERHIFHDGASLYGGVLRWLPDEDRFERVDDDRLPSWFASGYTELGDGRYIVGSTRGFELRRSEPRQERLVQSEKLEQFRKKHRMTWLGRDGLRVEDDTYLLPSVGGVVMYRDGKWRGGEWLYPTRLNRLLPDDMRFGQYGGREIYAVEKTSESQLIVATAVGTLIYEMDGGVAGLLVDNDLGHLAFDDVSVDRFSEVSELFLQNVDPESHQGRLLSKYNSLMREITKTEEALDRQNIPTDGGATDASSAIRNSEEIAEKLRKKLKEEKLARNRLLNQLETEERELYQMLKVDPQELSAMSSKVPENAVVLQYLPTKDKLFVQTVSLKGGTKIAKVEVGADRLNSIARSVRADLRASVKGIKRIPNFGGLPMGESSLNGGKLKDNLHLLYNYMLKPVELELESYEQVFIVPPPGDLSYVPFDAFVTRLEPNVEFATQKFKVAVVTSLFHLNIILSENYLVGKQALLIGNPDETLVEAELEVETVATLVKDPITLIGDDATIKKVQEASGDASLIHFATHGKLDAAKPYNSYLVMANGRKLRVADIATLSLNGTDLAVLSACETGIGGSGLEFATIARAFVNQKVPTVIASYWEVGDEATRSIMTHFYEYLDREPGRYLDALSYAKREMLAEDKWEPADWAGFTLFGKP